MNYYLAVDIGASSGRHILGWLEDGKMQYEEVYRFENGLVKKNNHLCWELDKLMEEILEGMKHCAKIGKIPISMGIDTWAVDFVLLDKHCKVLGDTVGYRDDRTKKMDEKVYEKISQEELYEKTGIQKLIFNSIYQLMALKEKEPDLLEEAEDFLMVPDYFNFLLTGIKKNEYTNATSTQLLNANTKQWDYELIKRLGFPSKIFREISKPGTFLGTLTEDIQKRVGFDCEVVLPATHDTGSAVLAVPTNEENTIYISSGTWSLMGIERLHPDCSINSMHANFTNEGGYEYRFRYLKNIMGLWMIQSVKKEFKEQISFGELCEKASRETIKSIVDCNDDCFLAPESMIEAVQEFCRKTDQKVPVTEGEMAAVIYNSLADCYRNTVEEIEVITGKMYNQINIVGGGSNADYLNELTAQYTEKKVFAGPTEATAIGNLTAQMLKTGDLQNLQAARKCIRQSFSMKEFGVTN